MIDEEMDEGIDREQMEQQHGDDVPVQAEQQPDVVPSVLDLPASWRAGDSGQLEEAAATKVDDAAVPIYLWNDVLLEDLGRETSFAVEEKEALEILRRLALCNYTIFLPLDQMCRMRVYGI